MNEVSPEHASSSDPFPAPFYLGCPIWAFEGWQGSLFTRQSKRHEWLPQYGSVFNTVEGNSTFYALPPEETITKWAKSAPAGFRFALKFPKEISHERRLVNAVTDTQAFLEVLAILAEHDKLGPSFLQLPPDFSFREFPALERYLRRLPRELPFAVEVRHSDYFMGGEVEEVLDSLLRELHMDRVMFDSRPLFANRPEDEHEKQAQKRKPNLPVHVTVTGSRPMVRFVCQNNLERCRPWIEEWAPTLAGWIEQGLKPFVFTHAPDDTFAPQFGRLLHQEVSRHTKLLPVMNDWPGETEPPPMKQQELF